jgi:hypothetical protein
VARAAGMTQAGLSRIERGLVRGVAVESLSVLAAVVGLELSVRAFPAGRPIRDASHAALVGRLRARVHASLTVRTEVPFPNGGDLRAWDATISGDGWRYGVEAETHPTDLQALERRLAIKQRDGGLDGLILLLLDSRHCRAIVREYGHMLAPRFPVSSRAALHSLGSGNEPSGNAVILL